MRNDKRQLISCYLKAPILKVTMRSEERLKVVTFVRIALEHASDSYLDKQQFIGLTNIKGEFSGEFVELAKSYMEDHPKVIIIPLTESMVQDSMIMSRMSGFINPGSADTFPKDRPVFGLDDMNVSKMLKCERVYQRVIKYAAEKSIPYLGICGGSQHLILGNGGKLQPVKGYTGSEIAIDFVSGSVAYYMSLNEDEKGSLLRECRMPEVRVPYADVNHHYAGVINSLGAGVELGAVSSNGNVVEAFSYGSKMLGYQYHPESQFETITLAGTHNRDKQVIESFFSLCQDHWETVHNAKVKGIPSLQTQKALAELDQAFLERLDECKVISKGYTPLPKGKWRDAKYLWGKVMGNHTLVPERGVRDDSIIVMPGILPEDIRLVRQGNDLELQVQSVHHAETLTIKDQFVFDGESAIDSISFANGQTGFLPKMGYGDERNEGGGEYTWNGRQTYWENREKPANFGVNDGNLMLLAVASHAGKKFMNWAFGWKSVTKTKVIKPKESNPSVLIQEKDLLSERMCSWSTMNPFAIATGSHYGVTPIHHFNDTRNTLEVLRFK